MPATPDNTATQPLPSPALHPEEGLKQELALLERVVQGQQSSGVLLWRCEQSLVVPRSLGRKPAFDQACAAMGAQGWPVVVRDTGGDLTPQAPGLINIALAFRQRRTPGAIRESYLRLCQPLIDSLAPLGIAAGCASVEGAFCNGDYNLVVAGRKLAGTAQRWRKMASHTGAGEDEFAVLVHAVILCDEPLAPLWQAGNAFYRACDIDQRIDPTLHVSLAELLPDNNGDLIHQSLVRFSACLQG
ncbi:lipoate--protein ligase family protein [Marinobacterium rhizophilum]|uniref:Lipoate--protein ligase family protein n=2 Tax=Marinobacterium rhizophilum TaxID=420402 RepID=A0ABY5HTK0_9GAMM|nr:lipoate--protein ligase family protein [Marinobacterium rhizophilum]